MGDTLLGGVLQKCVERLPVWLDAVGPIFVSKDIQVAPRALVAPGDRNGRHCYRENSLDAPPSPFLSPADSAVAFVARCPLFALGFGQRLFRATFFMNRLANAEMSLPQDTDDGLFETCHICGEVRRLCPREPHVRHLRMGIEQKQGNPCRAKIRSRSDGREWRCFTRGSALVWRHYMARRAPLTRKPFTIGRVGSNSC